MTCSGHITPWPNHQCPFNYQEFRAIWEYSALPFGGTGQGNDLVQTPASGGRVGGSSDCVDAQSTRNKNNAG